MAEQRITEARSAIHTTVYRTFLAVLSTRGRCGCLTDAHIARLFTAAQPKGETARHCTASWSTSPTSSGVRPDCTARQGLTEVARHQIALPGRPVIEPAHYPDHPQRLDASPRPQRPKPSNEAEEAFLMIGPGAEPRLNEASARGVAGIRTKMAAAVEQAAPIGVGEVDLALGLAATADRFEDEALMSIIQHRWQGFRADDLVIADEAHSVQPGTSVWADFGRTNSGPDQGSSS